jgi:CRP-like cAMP-binding protein
MKYFNDFLSQIPSSLQKRLLLKKTTKKLKKGDFLYRLGDTPQSIYVVEKGLVGLTYVGLKGEEHLLRIFKVGRVHGHRSIFANEVYHSSAVALEDSEISVIPKECLFEMIKQKPEMAFHFLNVLAVELKEAELKLISRSEKDVAGRIAETLIYLTEQYPEHSWTRREIAEFCGSTTPTVIKTMAKFEEKGWISQSGRKFLILKKKNLLSVSDD